MIYTYHYTSPLGSITLASNGESLTGLWFNEQKHFPHKYISESTEAELPIFTQTSNWLDIYFSGRNPRLHTSYKPEHNSVPQGGI